jgi:hypothetical protein
MGSMLNIVRKIKFILCAGCVLWASSAFAGERYEFYNGIRSLGMGGAAAAVVNDETALLANPAALGKLRNYFITVADPELDISSDTQAVIGTDVTAFMDPQTSLDKVNKAPRRFLHQRAQLFPSIVVPNFGFGVFGKYETDAFIDSTTTKFNFNYTNDMAAVFGFNLRLFDGRIKIGANARAVDRTEIHRDDIDTASTGLSIANLATEGQGVASDVGLILAAPWTWLPTLGFVYHDVGRTHYTMNHGMFHSPSSSSYPEATPPTLDAAFAVFPILSNRTRMAVTAEMKDVLKKLEPTETDVNRLLHYGFEVNFGDMFFVRGGMNQNYWTAGIELDIANSQLQIASYGEEVGTTTTKKEDRRYVGKFAWRF